MISDLTQHEPRQALTLEDVGDGAKQPVKPVEDGTVLALWIAAEQRDERLYIQMPETST